MATTVLIRKSATAYTGTSSCAIGRGKATLKRCAPQGCIIAAGGRQSCLRKRGIFGPDRVSHTGPARRIECRSIDPRQSSLTSLSFLPAAGTAGYAPTGASSASIFDINAAAPNCGRALAVYPRHVGAVSRASYREITMSARRQSSASGLTNPLLAKRTVMPPLSCPVQPGHRRIRPARDSASSGRANVRVGTKPIFDFERSAVPSRP